MVDKPKGMPRGFCDRCREKGNSFTMSIFNTDWICDECGHKEASHPMFQKARKIEAEHCKNGNYNFEGIGLPDDLR